MADLDNNGTWEFIADNNIQFTDTMGEYIAFHDDGAIFSDFPLAAKGNTYFKQMVLEDLDHDGFVDFIGAGDDLTSPTSFLEVWSTSIVYDSTKIINKYNQINKKHDGYYPLNIVNPVAEIKTEKKKTNISPNPFSNHFTIKSNQKIREIKIEDLQGRLLCNETLHQFSKRVVFAKPKSIYIATITFEDGSTEKMKIIGGN